MENETGPAAPRWPLVTFLLLCLAGLAVAGDLTVIHVRVHLEPHYQSFCAISKEVNCDTVAESEYSIFLGLPNAVWGLVGYLVMALLAAWGLTRFKLRAGFPAGLLLVFSTFSVAVSIVLAVISKLIIGSMCLMCMASWIVALGTLVLAVVIARPQGLVGSLRNDLAALLSRPALTATLAVVGFALLAVLWVAYPRYWQLEGPVGPGALAFGRDEQGLPWIGSKEAKLTIVEFSDYECPHCSKAHREVRQALEFYKDLRLVHRNYPLDQACNPAIKRPFHESACERARAAVCAGEQGRFWEMSDYLFLGQRRRNLDMLVLAQRVGLDVARFRACLAEPSTNEHLGRDLAEGRKVGVFGTPWFQVGGAQFAGPVPVERIGFVVCAGEQGKFAEASEAVFSHKGDFNPEQLGAALGLDPGKLQSCTAAQPKHPNRARR